MLTKDSLSDYDNTKRAEYFDADGYSVADKANKHKLKTPQAVKELQPEEKE